MSFYICALFLILIFQVNSDPVTIKVDNPRLTMVSTENITNAEIELKETKKRHHLFIGRCQPNDYILHEENIILTNDGKSHVTSKVRMIVEGPVYINCVNVYDEAPAGEGGYPHSPKGGIGKNFVEFQILTNYGKGYHFYVQIYGKHTH